MTAEKIEYYSKILSHSQLFHGVDDLALKEMVTKGNIIQVQAATSLLQEEQKVEGLHIILEGSAKVQKSDQVLSVLGRGAFFGEISLFGASFGATAAVITHDPCTLLVISKPVLDAWAKQFPVAERSFLRKLCTELCRRLYSTSERAL